MTMQNLLGSADFWTVTDEIVFGFDISAQFRGMWKRGGKRRTSEGSDGQRGEDAAWWALMHILEEWANKSHRKRKKTDDNPRPTPMKQTTSGPPGQLGPSGQPEPLTPDSSIRTPAGDPTPTADPTPIANPTPAADPTPSADSTLRVRPPINPSPPVRPPPVRPPPVCPLPVRSPPVQDTLGGWLVAGCRVWMITTHRQNGWHKVGRSGTTAQSMSPTVSDAVKMMRIQSRFSISGGHMGLSGGRSCRTRFDCAGLARGTSA